MALKTQQELNRTFPEADLGGCSLSVLSPVPAGIGRQDRGKVSAQDGIINDRDVKLYEKPRKLFPHSKRGPHKRVEAAVSAMKHYALDELLYRLVFDSTGERVRRVVVPNGD